MTPTEQRIEKMMAEDPNQTVAPALKAALEQKRKQDEVRQTELALKRLQVIDNNTQTMVSALREARKFESRAKAQLTKYVKAQDDFIRTGDWEAYSKAVQS